MDISYGLERERGGGGLVFEVRSARGKPVVRFNVAREMDDPTVVVDCIRPVEQAGTDRGNLSRRVSSTNFRAKAFDQ
jgi:hypothetical protein